MWIRLNRLYRPQALQASVIQRLDKITILDEVQLPVPNKREGDMRIPFRCILSEPSGHTADRYEVDLKPELPISDLYSQLPVLPSTIVPLSCWPVFLSIWQTPHCPPNPPQLRSPPSFTAYPHRINTAPSVLAPHLVSLLLEHWDHPR